MTDRPEPDLLRPSSQQSRWSPHDARETDSHSEIDASHVTWLEGCRPGQTIHVFRSLPANLQRASNPAFLPNRQDCPYTYERQILQIRSFRRHKKTLKSSAHSHTSPASLRSFRNSTSVASPGRPSCFDATRLRPAKTQYGAGRSSRESPASVFLS